MYSRTHNPKAIVGSSKAAISKSGHSTDSGLTNHLQSMVGNKEVGRIIQRASGLNSVPAVTGIPGAPVIQRLFLPQDNRHINDNQDTYKEEYNLAKAASRQVDLEVIMKAQSVNSVRPEAIMMAGPLKHLHPVSLASPAHWTHEVGDKFRSIAKHHYGWSFADISIQQADLIEINDFITQYEAGADVRAHAVTYKFNLPKVEYTVDGRTYSTHADSDQLYPISGLNITNGKGPIELGKAMKVLGILTNERAIKLYQIYCELEDKVCNQSALGSLSTQQKTEYLAESQKLIG
jgi:hypothetical protein